MPQISLYIDESTLKKVETLAKSERKSCYGISKIPSKSSLAEIKV